MVQVAQPPIFWLVDMLQIFLFWNCMDDIAVSHVILTTFYNHFENLDTMIFWF